MNFQVDVENAPSMVTQPETVQNIGQSSFVSIAKYEATVHTTGEDVQF
jgi:hypothetical protein